MKKLFKFVAIAALVLVLLVVAAIIIVPRVVDPQDLVAQAASVVKEKTGRDLKVSGAIEWDVFPWVELKLGDVALSNPPAFSDDVFAAAKRLEIRVKLLPLFEKKVELDTVVVHGLAVSLERLQDGRTNWADLAGEQSSSVTATQSRGGQESAEPSPSAATDGAPPIAALGIGGLDVRDATIKFVDAQSGQEYRLSNMVLESGALALGEPVDVKLGFDLASAKPQIQGRIELGANVLAMPETKSARFDGLALTADVRGEAVPMAQLRATFSGDAKLDGNAMTAAINTLNVSVEGKGAGQLPFEELKMALGGELTADGNAQQVAIDGIKLTIEGRGAEGAGFESLNATGNGKLVATGSDQTLDLSGLKIVADLTGSEDTPIANAKATLVGDVRAAAGQQSLMISGFRLDADLKGRAGGPFETARAVAQADISANAAAQSFKLAKFTVNADLTGPKIPAAASKASASANVDFDGAKGVAELSDFKVDLLGLKASGGLRGSGLDKGGQIKGRVSVSPFNPRRLAGLFGQQLPATADANALTSVALNTAIAISGNLGAGELRAIELNSLTAKLDESNISGRLAVADISKQALRFDLKIDRLNADRYMPPQSVGTQTASQSGASSPKSTPQAPTPGAAASAANVLPVAQLRALDIDGRLAIGAVKFNNMDASNVVATVKADRGVVRVSPRLGRSLPGNLSRQYSGGCSRRCAQVECR